MLEGPDAGGLVLAFLRGGLEARPALLSVISNESIGTTRLDVEKVFGKLIGNARVKSLSQISKLYFTPFYVSLRNSVKN